MKRGMQALLSMALSMTMLGPTVPALADDGSGGTGQGTAAPGGQAAEQLPDPDKAAPFYVTEVNANEDNAENKDLSYFEVYNASSSPINLSYFDILYYYNYPEQTAAQYGRTWSLSDFTATIQPGAVMVY